MNINQTEKQKDIITVIEETVTAQSEKIIYTGKIRASGGREKGSVKSSDGRLDIALGIPGGITAGTNPEQLFAAGWSACFEGAMKIAARKMKINFPDETSIDAEVDLCLINDAYSIQARLNVNLPHLAHSEADALIRAAHKTCPYSKATRGNINVTINLVYSETE